MMLAAGIGSEIEIETEGEDEAQAMAALVALIDDKFGEGAVAARQVRARTRAASDRSQ